MAEAGIEPASDSDASAESLCSCEFCQGYRAARALHSDRSNCLDVASLDHDLQEVIAVWGKLPKRIRATIMALAETAGSSSRSE
jgi:hypothetical protein